MKIKFLGAAGMVTGSSYLLTSGSGQTILIDLGMFQGPHDIDKRNFEPFDVDCPALSGVILTHAHLDHCGRLPILLPKRFKKKIYMTPQTKDLTELSLFDTAKIAKEDNRTFLFDKALVEQTVKQFDAIPYRTPFRIGDFTITMRDAGHILGSASLEIIDANPNSSMQKIVFSGDLGNSPEPLLMETELIESADAVVMESTYGDRIHPDTDPSLAIQKEINLIEQSGGTLLIPAFALERTQELLHSIMHLKKSGKVSPSTPVYLDSPMAKTATEIYSQHLSVCNAHIQTDRTKGHPFQFEGLTIIDTMKESSDIINNKGPEVIIAGSGMMTGGRILGHAGRLLPIPSTRLLIVGWQGEGTLGRMLLNGNKKVRIGRISVPVNGTINNIENMSAHADQNQLMRWLTHIKNVKKVFLTHGDDIPRAALAQKISKDLGITDVTMPLLYGEAAF